MSDANVLRGMHVHVKHYDYLTVVKGRVSAGLFDMRPQSPTYHRSALIELSSDRLTAIIIPNGVLHGFYHHDATVHVFGFDHYYNPDDDLHCSWSDPALGIAWPCTDPILVERDRTSCSLAELEAELRRGNAEFG